MFFFLLMGDSLVQYRAAIGLFNCFKFVSGFIVFLPPILFVVVLVVLKSSLSMLLLISGSVHPNPGPSSVNFSIAHLNARSLNVSDKLTEISVLASLYGFDVFVFFFLPNGRLSENHVFNRCYLLMCSFLLFPHAL